MKFNLILVISTFISIPVWACDPKPNQVDYVMKVELLEDREQVQGHEKITIKNNTCQALDKLYFHMYPNAFRWERDSTYVKEARRSEDPEKHFLKAGRGMWIKVDKIQAAEQEIKFSVDKELLTAELPTPLAADDTIVLDLPFTTQLAPFAERSGVWDGNFAVAQWFPKLMVYDKGGWALEHNRGYHYIGEFYGDFGSYDVSIVTDQKTVLGATGHKVSEALLDFGKKETRFQAENVHDFSWAADQKFSEKIIEVGKTKIHVLTRNPTSQVIGDYAASAFKYYSMRIGEYPYEDFTVAETYYNGPMEFPQMIFSLSWPAKFLRWVDRDATRLLEMAVVHETAHQWFYGVVGNNEVKDAWLDEGFATYLENAYMRDTHGSDQNILKFTSLAKFSDKQLSTLVWRLYAPDLSQPIQTPSYQFRDPSHYYASAYYKEWLMLHQFDSLVGREKFDEILQDYYAKNKFVNVEPETWYQMVREHSGAEAESWFRNWNNKVLKSDYAISKVESQKNEDGTYKNTFEVSQLGNHFVPVDVELIDKNGAKYRGRAPISIQNPKVKMEILTKEEISSAEVDPDQVAPDTNRFNKTPRFFPKVKVWPFTTRTLPSDAIGLYPLPWFSKKPGIGWETGLFLGIAHYVDWIGNGVASYDWRHKIWNFSATVDTLQPSTSPGWSLNYEENRLVHQGSFMIKQIYGPEVEHDPSGDLRYGLVYFGSLSDKRDSLGVGGSYLFSDIKNGRNPRGSAKVSNAVVHDVSRGTNFDRASLELKSNLELYPWVRFYMRNFLGHTFGKSQRSARFDLQAANEGGMRFDNQHLSQFKFRQILTSNFELRLPVPYTTFSDRLGIVHGPSWEWHLFSDMSFEPERPRYLVDIGIGSRFYFINESFGKLGLNLEYVPYQNATSPNHRWESPAFMLNLISVR